jgi:hypothetical protein
MSPDAIRSLNRLLALHSRSFPSYLQWSRPHVPSGREDAMQTLSDVAASHAAMSRRITQMLVDAEALPLPGEYPMDYTDSHDLDVDYLLRLSAAYQRQDIEAIEAIVESLRQAPAARAIAEEALGMARGHLETLTAATSAAAAS